MRTSQRVWLTAIMQMIVWFRFDRLFVECHERDAVCVTWHPAVHTTEGQSSTPSTPQKRMINEHLSCITSVLGLAESYVVQYVNGVMKISVKFKSFVIPGTPSTNGCLGATVEDGLCKQHYEMIILKAEDPVEQSGTIPGIPDLIE